MTTVLGLCWGGCGHRARVPRELAARGWRCLRCQRRYGQEEE